MTIARILRKSAALAGVALAAATVGIAATPAAAKTGASQAMTATTRGVVKNLQMGVGKSTIVDLPEEAAEIYVGDPKIANAIVRSAKRIYVSAVANGQTSIFALAKDGRKIAIIDVSVGRDVGELSSLLNAAIPGNDIHVRTVADSIILTGSVASAGEAQKALDIASGFVNQASGSFSFGAAGITASNNSNGKVINSLTIRGLDQVSLRVTIAEIRREIVKQLGVNMTGSGPNGSFTLDNPFAVNGVLAASEATLNWAKGNQSLSATLQAFEREGVAHTLAEPTVTAVSGESAKFMAGGTIPIATSEFLHHRNLPNRVRAAALRRNLEFYPRRPLRRAHSIANRDRSHRYRRFDADYAPWRRYHPRFPNPQQCDYRRTAFRRFDRLGRSDRHSDPTGGQWAARIDENSGARGPVPFA